MALLTRIDHEALLGTGNYTQRIDQTVPETCGLLCISNDDDP